MISIRPFDRADWPQVWGVMEPIIRAGDTYAFDKDMTHEQAYQIWVVAARNTYVAVNTDGTVVGTYYIKANFGGGGNHVANCGFMTGAAGAGQGVGNLMVQHSQVTAKELGFQAIQFNCVISTNKKAIKLWKKHRFDTVGILPKAFNHPEKGLVDAYVMYKRLG